mgnify:CR=1 FL=1
MCGIIWNYTGPIEKAEEAFKDLSKEIKHNEPEELFCNSALLKEQMQEYSLVVMDSSPTLKQVRGDELCKNPSVS